MHHQYQLTVFCHLFSPFLRFFQLPSGGGIIRAWDPLYRSEGATQVGFLELKYLLKLLKDIDPSEWETFFMCYDNMHIGLPLGNFSQVLWTLAEKFRAFMQNQSES